MTDNLSDAWRAIPLEDIMPYSRLLDDLERAGYSTAGDVLDAKPRDMARNVRGVGLRRARLIRQKVFDHVKPSYAQGEPERVLVNRETKEPTPSRADTLMTLGAMGAVALLFFVTVSILL